MKKTVLTIAALSAMLTSGFAQTNAIKKGKNPFSVNKTQKQSSYKTSHQGLPQKAVNYTWDGTEWEFQDTSMMAYAHQGILVSTTRKNETDFISRSTSEFNSHKYNTLNKYFFWNTGEWELSGADSTVLVYNGSNLIEKRTNYWFDGTDYVASNRVSNTYTTGNLTSQVTEKHDGTSWENDEKMDITYDGANKPSMAVQYEWDGGATAWVPSMRFIDVQWESWNGMSGKTDDIGEAGKFKSLIMQQWNETESAWDTVGRMTVTYDANGGSVQTIAAYMMGIFIDGQKNHTINDSKGNTIEQKNESFEGMSWKMESGTKYNHTYDGADNIIETITMEYNQIDKKYENSAKSVFSDFVIAAGVKSIAKNNNLSVYPNPMTSNATISLSGDVAGAVTVIVFDNMGRKVQEVSSTSNNVVIERNNLKNGIYFYNVVNNNNVVANGKLVIE